MTTGDHSLESLSRFLEEAHRRYGLSSGDQPDLPIERQAQEVEPPEDGWQGSAEYLESRREMDAAWHSAMQAFRDGQIVSALVTGWNRGGLLVRWGKLQGFVPSSQLKEVPLFEDEDSRDEKLANWVGEELDLRIIELDRTRDRLVFSERATMWGPRDGERLLAEIRPGEARRGHVSNLRRFGAFVDLGGIDGLIHISELSWGRVTHPSGLLSVGQEVEVYVLGVDKENCRIALSLKRLHPNPWLTVEERYHVGQVTRATITNIVDFGAFAQIEDGVEGLIHISELSHAKVTHPSDLVIVGDRVLVRILRIDSANHRLGLSMRQTPGRLPIDDSEPPAEAKRGARPGFLY